MFGGGVGGGGAITDVWSTHCKCLQFVQVFTLFTKNQTGVYLICVLVDRTKLQIKSFFCNNY